MSQMTNNQETPITEAQNDGNNTEGSVAETNAVDGIRDEPEDSLGGDAENDTGSGGGSDELGTSSGTEPQSPKEDGENGDNDGSSPDGEKPGNESGNSAEIGSDNVNPTAEIKDGAFIPPEPVTTFAQTIFVQKGAPIEEPISGANPVLDEVAKDLESFGIALDYERVIKKDGEHHWNLKASITKGEDTFFHTARLTIDFMTDEFEEVYKSIVRELVQAR